MSLIRQPSTADLTRLNAVADRLNRDWSELTAQELLTRVMSPNAFVKNPVLVSSFGADSSVLLHMLSVSKPAAAVVFLDTGFHFSETIAYKNALIGRLKLTSVRVASVDPIAAKRADAQKRLHLSNPDGCCHLRKVSVLDRHLRMNDAWISGQRRSQSSTRENVGRVEVDSARGKLKFNPLANWSDGDIAAYKAINDLPEHPLTGRGYPSIGCMPCTTAVEEGEDTRAGRWRGQQKLECGLHNRPQIIASTENVA